MFKKRETVLQNMTYIALMSAINIIFVLLTTILPFLYVLIIFLLPLTSVIVFLYCKKWFFPIYALATIGLCLIFNLWRVTDTIFYVIPSMITGAFFGFAIERKIPAFFTILFSTIIQVGITYASFPLINLLVEINTIDYFLNFFKLGEFAYKDFLPPVFIFVISSIQMLLTYIVIRDEIKRMGYEINGEDASDFLLFIIEITSIILSIGFAFIFGPLSLLFMGFAVYIGIYHSSILLARNKIVFLVSSISCLLITIFAYALLNKYVQKPYAILIILMFFLLMSVISFSNYCLEKSQNKDKLE